MPSPIQSESPPSIILPNFTLNQKEINLRNVEFITPWQGWNDSACGGHSTTTKKTDSFLPHLRNQTSKSRYIYIQQSYNNRNNTCYPLVCRTRFPRASKRQPMFTIIEPNQIFWSHQILKLPQPTSERLRSPFCESPQFLWVLFSSIMYRAHFKDHTVSHPILGDWLGKWKER